MNYLKSKEYEDRLFLHDEEYFQPVLEFLEQNKINKNSKILDVGCGVGSLVNILRNRGYKNTYGIDLDSDFIARGRNHYALNEALFDNETAPFSEKTFDMVLSFTVAEHVDCIQSFVDFKIKFLKEAGIFYLFAPNFNDVLMQQRILGDKIGGRMVINRLPFSEGGLSTRQKNYVKQGVF